MKFYAQFHQPTGPTYSGPIIDRINGEWKLISHKGTEEYLKKKQDEEFNDLIFMYSNQSFKCDEKHLTQTQMIGSQKVFEQKACFNVKFENKGTITTTCLNYNKLRTVNTYQIEGEKVDDIEERFIDASGHLIIVNQFYYKFEHRYTVLECTRTYERVECGSEKEQESIKDTVVGMWHMIAANRHEELRRKWATESSRLKFTHAHIFNEIQMQHMDMKENVLKFNFAVMDEEPKYTGTFLFDNSLVTVDGDARIVFNVKDDKLFVIGRKNEHSFFAVYQKTEL